MNQKLEKLIDDLHNEAFCPSCHHGEGMEIPNAERVIEEAYLLGVETVKPTQLIEEAFKMGQESLKTPCDTHTCDYYRHYLAHGPVELTHESYHGAYETCLRWQERAEEYYQNDKPIPVYIESQCRKWEKKVRA